mmetsp:Transcript_6743/g.3783  ORF Transcript_6743/g.3783 Transcript_6743/m.3783 type:complete len:95 (+) Transcript_6743:178-462(+)
MFVKPKYSMETDAPRKRDVSIGFYDPKKIRLKSGLPTYEGMLLRKAKNVLMGWLERYFVIEDKVLRYYRKKDDVKPAGVLDFDFVSAEVFVLGK